MRADLLSATWDAVTREGDDAIGFFYAALFAQHPEVRHLFGDDMRGQRAKLAATINLVVRHAANPEAVIPRLRRLGRDHARFGAVAEHYPAVADALLYTLEVYLGEGYTDEVRDAWTEALTTVAGVMVDAAANPDGPAQWLAPILKVQRYGPDAAWIIVDPGPEFPFTPGCAVPVAIEGLAGTERPYRPEAPYPDHPTVLAVWVEYDPADPVTLALLNNPGDRLRLGPPLPPEDPS